MPIPENKKFVKKFINTGRKNHDRFKTTREHKQEKVKVTLFVFLFSVVS